MVAMLQYTYYNGVPSAMIDAAIANNKLDLFNVFITFAIFCQLMGVTTAVCLLFGAPNVWIVLGVALAAYLVMFVFFYLYNSAWTALGFGPLPKMDAVADDEKDDKEDATDAGDDKADDEEKEPEAEAEADVETGDAEPKEEEDNKDGQQTNIIEIDQESEKVQQE